ncbi:hypothetical protein [Burkholderia arboris]|uniref:hypothetical protein n=1 Tax=Burkholderia arboris TaxID=488730 RepID=UPI001CF5E510|nr:hypothetical protein [Burkholderia arboris]MCA8047514.1 hypothetical protein [Burkholderia arboris]
MSNKKTMSIRTSDGLTGMQMQKIISQGEGFGKALTGTPMQPVKVNPIPIQQSSEQPTQAQPTQTNDSSQAKASE